MVPQIKKGVCIVTFGKVVINNTRWLFEDAPILKNARIVLPDILDRTREDTEDRLHVMLVDRATEDDINECPANGSARHSLLF